MFLTMNFPRNAMMRQEWRLLSVTIIRLRSTDDNSPCCIRGKRPTGSPSGIFRITMFFHGIDIKSGCDGCKYFQPKRENFFTGRVVGESVSIERADRKPALSHDSLKRGMKRLLPGSVGGMHDHHRSVLAVYKPRSVAGNDEGAAVFSGYE